MKTLTQKILAAVITTAALSLGSGGVAAAENPYDGHVECEGKSCKVDKFMTKGFRAFSQCQVCHGIDGNGSSFAPSLLEKLREIDKTMFLNRVTNGFKGQIGVMPPWKENPNVMKNVDSLYAYLKARSDKVLPSGRLQRFDRGEKKATTTAATAPTAKTEAKSAPKIEVQTPSSGFGAAKVTTDTKAASKVETQAPSSGFGSLGNIN